MSGLEPELDNMDNVVIWTKTWDLSLTTDDSKMITGNDPDRVLIIVLPVSDHQSTEVSESYCSECVRWGAGLEQSFDQS